MTDEWQQGFGDGFIARVASHWPPYIRVVSCLAMMSLDALHCPYATEQQIRAVQSQHDQYPRGFLAGWGSRLVRDLPQQKPAR